MAEAATRDAVIVGGGHNGLVCAAYLAAAGLRVTVLERRHVAGGAAVTEEFHPGYRNSVAAHAVSLLHPTVIRDLQLVRHGLHVVSRRLEDFVPLEDGRYLKSGGGRTAREVAKFSPRDAGRLDAYEARFGAAVGVLRDLVLRTPPNPTGGGWHAALPELVRGLGWGRAAVKLDPPARRELLDLMLKSAGEHLDGWFECDPLKALRGFAAIAGNYASPYAAGSAYLLLHHALGECNGVRGAWGHAIGGMGAVTQAMARAAERRGVEIRTGAAVREIIVAGRTATGVVTERGEAIRARCVVSNVNPRLLYGTLIDAAALDAAFRERMLGWRCASGTFRISLALAELPDFSALPGRRLDEHHTAAILLAPDLAAMDSAHADARRLGWARRPIVQMLIPSALDGSLAPPGRHVASLLCQHVAPTLPDGVSWDRRREEVADLMIGLVDRYAPNFRASILGRQILSPLDLERTFGLIGGDIHHGAMSLDQMFAARPMLGFGDYRGPLDGLYLCGAGVHPGGGVSGAPGHNAARAVIGDLRRRRWRWLTARPRSRR